jgi:glucokinase
LYQGTSSGAGELGHVTILPDGPLCACGNRGCLNALASGSALLGRAKAAIAANPEAGAAFLERCGHDLDRLRLDDLAALAAGGSVLARSLVREAGQYIGISAAGIINLLNPDYLLVGGPMAAAGHVLLDAIRQEARQRALTAPSREARIGFSKLGTSAMVVGAASLVLRAAPRLLARARS